MSAVSKESEDEAEAAGTSSMMESSMMEGEEYYNPDTTVAWSEKVSGGEQLCRICAGPNEYLIPIFSGEGLEHQLGMKIEKHLPIQVLEHDKLPVQVCYQCASTLIAWHDLVVGCVEAEKKLRQLYQQQNVEEEEEEDDFGDDDRTELFADPVDSEMAEDPLEPSTSTSTATRSTRSPRKKSVTRAKPKLKMTLVKTPAALPKSPPKLLQPKEEQVEADPATERSSLLSWPTTFKSFHQPLCAMKKLCPPNKKPLTQPSLWIKREDCSSSTLNQCHFCMAACHSRGDLATHLTQTHSDNVFHCATCDEFFKKKRLLVIHSQKHVLSAIKSEDSCLELGENELIDFVPNKINLKSKLVLLCGKCGRYFKRRHLLSNHTCIRLPKDVPHNANVLEPGRSQDSIKVVTESSKKEKHKTLFRCELCGKNFTLKDSYKSHQRIHTGEKPFTCHICGKSFSHTGGLYYHLKHVHAGVKNHGCDICGRSFALKAAMEDHRRIHTGERPYVCHTCGKAFKTKASLYIHSKIHTDSFPHPCTYCERRFRWRQQLLAHVTTHTGEKPHTCDTCGKGFGVKNDLTRHKLTHSDSKPFSCSLCSLSFGQKRYLKNHHKSRHGLQT